MSDPCRFPGCTRDDATSGYCPAHHISRAFDPNRRLTPPHMLGAKAAVEASVKLNKEEGPVAKARRLEQELADLKDQISGLVRLGETSASLMRKHDILVQIRELVSG